MTLSRADVDALVTRLRSGLRPIYLDVDVFADVDDDAMGAFEPSDHGRGRGFFTWSKTAGAALERNVLTQPLAAQFGGLSRARLQMLLADLGWTARVEVDDDDAPAHKLYGPCGTVVIPPDADAIGCDLNKLVAAFRALEADGVIALPCTGYTQSDGWSDVAERTPNDGDDDDDGDDVASTACFWTDQGHDGAFDGAGRLIDELNLYWRGSAERIAETLRAHGFVVVTPHDESSSITVRASSPPADEAFIPRFVDVLPTEPRVGSRSADVKKRGNDVFVVDAAARSPEWMKISHLAFSPSLARLAIGHEDGERGSPDKSVVIVDARSGAVIAQPERREYARPGCGGFGFLDDSKLCVAWLDYLPRASWSVRKPKDGAGGGKRLGGRRIVARAPAAAPAPAHQFNTICPVLEVIDVDGGPAREIFVAGFEHCPKRTAMVLSSDRSTAALATRDGIVSFDVVTGAERACVGGAPLDSYAMMAVSCDGTRFAWTSDAGPAVRIVDNTGAFVCELRALEHNGPRGFIDLAFSRASTSSSLTLALLGRRHERDDTTRTSLELFDAATGARAWPRVEAASRGATAFAFHPTRALVALGFADGSVRLVSAPDGGGRARAPVLDGAVTCIAFSDDGARFAAGDALGRFCIGALVL